MSIKIIVKEPMKEAVVQEVHEINTSLKEIRDIVGGGLEWLRILNSEYFIALDEIGKYKHLDPNLRYMNQILPGTVVICKADREEQFHSLNDEEIEGIKGILSEMSIDDVEEMIREKEMIKKRFPTNPFA